MKGEGLDRLNWQDPSILHHLKQLQDQLFGVDTGIEAVLADLNSAHVMGVRPLAMAEQKVGEAPSGHYVLQAVLHQTMFGDDPIPDIDVLRHDPIE